MTKAGYIYLAIILGFFVFLIGYNEGSNSGYRQGICQTVPITAFTECLRSGK